MIKDNKNASLRDEVSILSPLRYPGSKRRLGSYIKKVIKLNGLRPKVLVEPFTGGGSVSLQLVNDGLVECVALGEKDPLIASFWKTVFQNPEWLINEIENIDISIDKWDFFRENSFSTDKEKALACLFLNRTSFSGILADSAGPIGGRKQKSKYKINCRFPVPTIINRIRQIAKLEDRVLFIENADWKQTMEKTENMGYQKEEVLYYLDPPFYKNANRLYEYFFVHNDHVVLRDYIIQVQKPWVLSYDPAQPILDLYSNNGKKPRRVGLLYSVSSTSNNVEAQELIISNLSRLPKETRLWRAKEEWRK